MTPLALRSFQLLANVRSIQVVHVVGLLDKSPPVVTEIGCEIFRPQVVSRGQIRFDSIALHWGCILLCDDSHGPSPCPSATPLSTIRIVLPGPPVPLRVAVFWTFVRDFVILPRTRNSPFLLRLLDFGWEFQGRGGKPSAVRYCSTMSSGMTNASATWRWEDSCDSATVLVEGKQAGGAVWGLPCWIGRLWRTIFGARALRGRNHEKQGGRDDLDREDKIASSNCVASSDARQLLRHSTQ